MEKNFDPWSIIDHNKIFEALSDLTLKSEIINKISKETGLIFKISKNNDGNLYFNICTPSKPTESITSTNSTAIKNCKQSNQFTLTFHNFKPKNNTFNVNAGINHLFHIHLVWGAKSNEVFGTKLIYNDITKEFKIELIKPNKIINEQKIIQYDKSLDVVSKLLSNLNQITNIHIGGGNNLEKTDINNFKFIDIIKENIIFESTINSNVTLFNIYKILILTQIIVALPFIINDFITTNLPKITFDENIYNVLLKEIEKNLNDKNINNVSLKKIYENLNNKIVSYKKKLPLISNEKFPLTSNNDLAPILVNSFFKKYQKYKYKYLNLKKLIHNL